MIKNIFDKEVSEELFSRINAIQQTQKPLWGKMSADQMFAHCSVAYTMAYEPEKFKKPNFLMKGLMKLMIKNLVVSEKPYKKNGHTAPDFLITESKDFEKEKAKLIENISKTQQLGFKHFDGKESLSFGKLTGQEWNNMFYKHIDHHLTQFGV